MSDENTHNSDFFDGWDLYSSNTGGVRELEMTNFTIQPKTGEVTRRGRNNRDCREYRTKITPINVLPLNMSVVRHGDQRLGVCWVTAGKNTTKM